MQDAARAVIREIEEETNRRCGENHSTFFPVTAKFAIAVIREVFGIEDE